jgi:hypothetical protein
LARRTKTTTTSVDSGAKHSGTFQGSVAKARAPGKESRSANVSPQGVANHQHGTYSYYTVEDGVVTGSLPTAGLDTDTN